MTQEQLDTLIAAGMQAARVRRARAEAFACWQRRPKWRGICPPIGAGQR